MKKILSSLLVMILLVGSFDFGILNVFAKETVIIHYHRDDNNYDDWNIWAWGEGLQGSANEFTGEDNFGKIAVLEVDSNTKNIGFIVRTDDWDKDFVDDRFIDLNIGNEIWVFSEEGEFYYETPEDYIEDMTFENARIQFDYYRYDNEYRGIVLKANINGETLEEPFLPTDYGTKAILELGNLQDVKGLDIVIENTMGQYEMILLEKTLYMQNANEDGVLYVNAEQGKDKVNYKEREEMNKTITSAKIEAPNKIRVVLSEPAVIEDSTFTLETLNGEQLNIENIKSTADLENGFEKLKDGYSIACEIITTENLDFGGSYVVKNSDFGSIETSLGNVFDSELFNELYYYDGDDLGATYTKENTSLRVWAPTAKKVKVLIFAEGEEKEGDTPTETYEMLKAEKGTWTLTLDGDYKNKFYNYEVHVNNQVNVAVDPYAVATGVNGMRGMIVDLQSTDPEGFREVKKPELNSFLDTVIYEIHVRDLSVDDNSGIENKGKFLGFTEEGTKNSEGDTTGLDYIKELGVTHIHFLPSYDYKTVDESSDEPQFNWGYDPQNYNVPEGSYSTNAFDGNVRINEFKETIKTLNENDLRVVMDVVYNHTYTGDTSNLNLVVPDYYYRKDENNQFTDGSGCGNETASERPMVRKYFVDSVVYWAKEYQVDGFRFDLMGVHDVDTMNEIRSALNEIDKDILIYGEGWTGGPSPLPAEDSAVKANTHKMDNNIAAFSDDIRDGIKGDVFIGNSGGFVSGENSKIEDVKFGIVAGMKHPQIDISQVDYSPEFWANAPTQVINYISAHDNLTLWDKLQEVDKMAYDEDLLKVNKLGATIVFTSQGIPFFQAGEEFARTKNGNENSYKSPDAVNKLDWSRRSEFNELVEYYKGLIDLRKKYSSFRLETADEIIEGIKFLDSAEGVIAYELVGSGDYNKFTLIFNNNEEETLIDFGDEIAFDILVDEEKAGSTAIERMDGVSEINVAPVSALVIGHVDFEGGKGNTEAEKSSERRISTPILSAILGLGAVFVGGYLGAKARKNKKK